MLEDLGPSLKEWFQERGGGTRNAYLGNKGQFLHHLGVLPGADISLSCWPLIPFILLSWDVEVALLWCLVMPSGEVLPPRLSYCPPPQVSHYHMVVPASRVRPLWSFSFSDQG